MTDIDADAAAALAGELDGAISFRLDVTDEDESAAMAASAVEAWGGIDIVVAPGARSMYPLIRSSSAGSSVTQYRRGRPWSSSSA